MSHKVVLLIITARLLIEDSPKKDESNYSAVYIYFIYLLAALGLRCCARVFSSCSEQGLLFVAVRGLLLLRSMGSRHRLQ